MERQPVRIREDLNIRLGASAEHTSTLFKGYSRMLAWTSFRWLAPLGEHACASDHRLPKG